MTQTKNPALAYRQQAVTSASPLGLVVLLYDAALTSLHKAIRALDARDVETRIQALDHVLDIIAQLQQTLNFDNDNVVAKTLDRFYHAARATITDANFAQSRDTLMMLATQMQGIRDAWHEADRKERPVAAMTPKPAYAVESYAGSPAGWSA